MGNERRERYAAAIQRRATGGIKLNSILPEVYDAADAAMAVADGELVEAQNVACILGDEVKRLREELTQVTKRRDEYAFSAGVNMGRAIAAESVIERVRANLRNGGCSDAALIRSIRGIVEGKS